MRMYLDCEAQVLMTLRGESPLAVEVAVVVDAVTGTGDETSVEERRRRHWRAVVRNLDTCTKKRERMSDVMYM